MYNAVITESSHFLPEQIVTNVQLSAKYKEAYHKKFSIEFTPELWLLIVLLIYSENQVTCWKI